MLHACSCSPTLISVALLSACVGTLLGEDGGSLPDVIITADREARSADATTVTTHVVNADDMRLLGHPPQLSDMLRSIPGMTIENTAGGMGGVIRISLRGTSTSDTLVLLDGIPFADPSGPQRQPQLNSIGTAGITRIEVVPGAQSGIYGSDAVGGVVQVIGQRPTETHRGLALAEFATFQTTRVLAQASGPISGGIGYAAGVEGLTSAGYSAQGSSVDPGNPAGFEGDPLRNGSMNARVEAPLSSAFTAWVSALASANREALDISGPDDSESHKHDALWRFAGGVTGNVAEHTEFDARAAHTRIEHHYHDTGFDQHYSGADDFLGLRLARKNLANVDVALGIDVRRQMMEVHPALGSSTTADDSNIGVYGQLDYRRDANRFALAVRSDVHSREGDATTFRISAARDVVESWLTVHAAIATGFRAPSLYELYAKDDYGSGPIGNAQLRPQTNTTTEIGITARPHADLRAELTFFRTVWQDKIVQDGGFAAPYANVRSDAQVEGIEWSGRWKPANDPLFVRVAATLQRSDAGNGTALAYTPNSTATAEIGYDMREYLVFAQVVRTGSRYASTNEKNTLSANTVLNAHLSWVIDPQVNVYARAQNLTGEHVETGSFGFGDSYIGTPRSVAVGANVSW